jgi:hypothetical protein
MNLRKKWKFIFSEFLSDLAFLNVIQKSNGEKMPPFTYHAFKMARWVYLYVFVIGVAANSCAFLLVSCFWNYNHLSLFLGLTMLLTCIVAMAIAMRFISKLIQITNAVEAEFANASEAYCVMKSFVEKQMESMGFEKPVVH